MRIKKNKFVPLLLAVLMSVLFVSCSKEEDAPVKVSGVKLNQSSLTLKMGETSKLTATVSPNDAADKTVKFASEDTSIATVSEDGVVTAVSKGSTVIVAYTADGSNKYTTCLVSVKQAITGIATATIDGKDAEVEWVQLWADGPKFAKWNYGATKASEYGTAVNWNTATKKDANFVWGKNWRCPSEEEMHKLFSYCDQTWTEVDNVKGFLFTGAKGTDFESNSIFIPADNSYRGEGRFDDWYYGNLWTSGTNSDDTGVMFVYDYEGHAQYKWQVGFEIADVIRTIEVYLRPVLN